MNLRKLTGAAVAAALALPMFVSGANAYELVIPSMDYRTGPLPLMESFLQMDGVITLC